MSQSSEICHYGIKGMRWGVRRYQNPDGSLTPAGRKRVLKTIDEGDRQRYKQYGKLSKEDRAKAASTMTDQNKELIRRGAKLQTERTTKIGTMLGGPFVGIPAGLISNALAKKRLSDLDADIVDQGRAFTQQTIRKSGNQTVAMLTADQAKRMGLDDSTKLSDAEASEIWKAMAAEYVKSQKRN